MHDDQKTPLIIALLELRRKTLTQFLEEFIEILESQGYSFTDLLDATAGAANNRAKQLNSQAMRQATTYLEKAVESARANSN